MTILIKVSSPIKDITFGQGMLVSLDHYYDILKQKAGQLGAQEFLQLKVIADTIDLSSEDLTSNGGYVWFSYFNLLNRSDRAIEPDPVSGGAATSGGTLAEIYGKFLSKLRQFVVVAQLSADDQKRLAELEEENRSMGNDITRYYILDRTNWKKFAEEMGYRYGDDQAFIQWAQYSGNLQSIQTLIDKIQSNGFERNSILARSFNSPEDEDVIKADFAYSSASNRLRYPVYPDHQYDDGDKFSPVYMARLPLGSTAIFDDRLAMTWSMGLKVIKKNVDGAFTGAFGRKTRTSNSISKDWGGSANVSYGFISARASAAESVRIQDDFSKGTKIMVGAKAAFRIGINPPPWFKTSLFTHKYVKENPKDFEEFFGPKGKLRYYPVAIVVVRGVTVGFESEQNWTYDYKKSFSASGGGGFGAFGFSFGGSASYSSTVREHQVDQTGTMLSFSDDPDTVRFVGYVVAKNAVFDNAIDDMVKKWS